MDLVSNEVLQKRWFLKTIMLRERIDMRNAKEGVGSSDVGNLSHRIPVFQVMISVDSPALPHTDAFAEACRGKRGADIAVRAAKAMAMTGVDLFNNPDLVNKAKEELKERLNVK